MHYIRLIAPPNRIHTRCIRNLVRNSHIRVTRTTEKWKLHKQEHCSSETSCWSTYMKSFVLYDWCAGANKINTCSLERRNRSMHVCKCWKHLNFCVCFFFVSQHYFFPVFLHLQRSNFHKRNKGNSTVSGHVHNSVEMSWNACFVSLFMYSFRVQFPAMEFLHDNLNGKIGDTKYDASHVHLPIRKI